MILPVPPVHTNRCCAVTRETADALLGMAAIAIRQNGLRSAEGLVPQGARSRPQGHQCLGRPDQPARAGRSAKPPKAGSRACWPSQPDSPTLNFALGNLYAGQRRWPEAQLAYFNAHTADPTHPDYLFVWPPASIPTHLPKVALDY